MFSKGGMWHFHKGIARKFNEFLYCETFVRVSQQMFNCFFLCDTPTRVSQWKNHVNFLLWHPYKGVTRWKFVKFSCDTLMRMSHPTVWKQSVTPSQGCHVTESDTILYNIYILFFIRFWHLLMALISATRGGFGIRYSLLDSERFGTIRIRIPNQT